MPSTEDVTAGYSGRPERKINEARKSKKKSKSREVKEVKSDEPVEEAQAPPCCAADGQSRGDCRTTTQKKRRAYPETCPPENVWLEFAPNKGDWHATGIAWSDRCRYPKGAAFKVGNRKLNAPGWLIELSEGQVQAVNKIKDYMGTIKRKADMTQEIDDLHGLLAEFGAPDITKPEVTRVLRYCPHGKGGGLDYRLFMFALGDFSFAALRNAISPSPRKFTTGKDQDDAELTKSPDYDAELADLFDVDEGNDPDSFYEVGKIPKQLKEEVVFLNPMEDDIPSNERDAMFKWRKKAKDNRKKQILDQEKWAHEKQAERKAAIQKYKEKFSEKRQAEKSKVEDEKRSKAEKEEEKEETKKRLTQQFIDDGVLPLTAAKKAEQYMKRLETDKIEQGRSKDPNKYTPRQQVFWTGLFLAEMYDTVDLIRARATNPCGFVPHKVPPRIDVLYKEWRKEQLERAAAARSPYLEPLAFVSNRCEKVFPNRCRGMPKNSKSKGVTQVKFDHWILDIPPEGEGRVVVTENRFRIRQILDYVCFKSGSAICHLPHVELMLHFAHNLVDQMLGRDSPEKGGGPKDEDEEGSVAPSPKASKTKEAEDPPPPAPFQNPACDGKPEDECKPRDPPEECPIDYTPPKLPARFKGCERAWVRKWGHVLYRKSKARDLRPEEEILDYTDLEPVRRRMEMYQEEDWSDYLCRRYDFRKSLWETFKVQEYQSPLQRDRFASAFWALLPPDVRQPRAAINTNVERALTRF